jgi:hypothetical protein
MDIAEEVPDITIDNFTNLGGTLEDESEYLGGTFEIRFSPFLGINCIVNADGTMGMVVLFKLKPAEDSPDAEFYDEEAENEYHAILQKALISATAPGATTQEHKEISSQWEDETTLGKEQTELSVKGIAYMSQTDTSDPALAKDFFYITFED